MKKTALALVTVVILASCGGSDDNASDATDAPAGTDAPAATDAPEQTTAPSSTEATNEGADDGVLAVPDEFATIQEAVDAASPGDLVLISPGVYNEAVNVTTDELTIRGLDRNEVILDGQFELDNGVRVLGASGVAVENLTAQNYTNNGVFWTSVDGYRGSYLTAYRNGDYGIYAFDSVNGLLEHSYASGSPDAGFYIGQCYECNAVMDDVISEYNGLGYSGTTSGGNLYIINSRFNNNRAGINMNSATYELCYPQRRATIVGNTVYDNNQTDTPAIDDAILAQNNGILVEGGIGNVIERNLVFDQGKVGIGLVPFPEFEPNDAEPSEDTWDLPCSETRDLPLADPDTLEAILWSPKQNRVVGNVVENSGVADLADLRCRRFAGTDRPHHARQLLRRQRVHVERTHRHRSTAAVRGRRQRCRLPAGRPQRRQLADRCGECAAVGRLRQGADADATAARRHARRGNGSRTACHEHAADGRHHDHRRADATLRNDR